jgi:starvation-inducible DNA-binding protein
MLQEQLSRYNDLHLTVKHVHWNVIGPNFIAVHQMIDPQVALVRRYADEAAERIATLAAAARNVGGRSNRFSTSRPAMLATRPVDARPGRS